MRTHIPDVARLAVAEDNAHGLFGEYARPCLGTPGCLASQTFRATKKLKCGGRGALVINDPQYIDRADNTPDRGAVRGRPLSGRLGLRFDEKPGHRAVAAHVSERLGSFPFHNSLAIGDGERVVSVAGQFRCKSYSP